jgi:hypothetical protein
MTQSTNSLPKLIGVDNWDAWSCHMRNQLVLNGSEHSNTMAWDISGNPIEFAGLNNEFGTQEEQTQEQMIWNALEMRAMAIIESALPNHSYAKIIQILWKSIALHIVYTRFM